eukprot:3024951-Rhodomonas_salina.2
MELGMVEMMMTTTTTTTTTTTMMMLVQDDDTRARELGPPCTAQVPVPHSLTGNTHANSLRRESVGQGPFAKVRGGGHAVCRSMCDGGTQASIKTWSAACQNKTAPRNSWLDSEDCDSTCPLVTARTAGPHWQSEPGLLTTRNTNSKGNHWQWGFVVSRVLRLGGALLCLASPAISGYTAVLMMSAPPTSSFSFP